jgi:hypothetical protein
MEVKAFGEEGKSSTVQHAGRREERSSGQTLFNDIDTERNPQEGGA